MDSNLWRFREAHDAGRLGDSGDDLPEQEDYETMGGLVLSCLKHHSGGRHSSR